MNPRYKKFIVLGVLAILLTVSAVLLINYDKEAYLEINLTVTSDAFKDNEFIPVKYSGKGKNISPPISLGEISSKASTIAIIMDDPDASFVTFTHWLIWNIPAKSEKISEGVPKEKTVPTLDGALQGKNDFGSIGYRGPQPPSGTHTYRIKVYVLDKALDLQPGANKSKLLKVMEGHILQYGMLKGKFSH